VYARTEHANLREALPSEARLENSGFSGIREADACSSSVSDIAPGLFPMLRFEDMSCVSSLTLLFAASYSPSA